MNQDKPFKDDDDAWEPITVNMLIRMLNRVPGDYLVGHDGGYEILKRDFTIYRDDKVVSING